MHTRTLALGVVLATALSSATALASADAATSHHATGTARAGAYVVDASVNETEPLLDSKVKIKAKVSPAAPGAAVTLQVRYQDQKRWKTIGHGRLNGQSKVTFKDKVSSVRERRYRVVKPAGDNHGAAQGNTPKVTVFGWRSIIGLDNPIAVGIRPTTSMHINGTDYGYGIHADGPDPAGGRVWESNLNRDCTQFRATAGLDDSSATAGTGSVQISTDGTPRYSAAFGIGQSQAVAFDVTDAFRMTVTMTAANGGIPALGHAELLCSF
jgi:hypothetical protein